MKIAVSGKGGVGKTTLSALMVRHLAGQGKKVLAVDADPNANLGIALGMPDAESVTPIVEMRDLIKERTGAKAGSYGSYFKLNPKVDDIPDKYVLTRDGVRLVVMGTIRKGGRGCACPENALLKALVNHLLLERDEAVVMDMEAGVEHLGRGTAAAVDKLLIVVEPGRRSIGTAGRIADLARDVGIKSVGMVANKVHADSERAFVSAEAGEFDIEGYVPYDDGLASLEQKDSSVWDYDGPASRAVADILGGMRFS